MHLLVRDTHSLDDDAPAQEPGQTPAPLVMLSFSDADLGALAAAWTPAHPELRLASLNRLRHPMSVDLYLEQVLSHARCIVIRLLGGLDYWRYGAEETAALCRERGIALALLPGCTAQETRLRDLSTIPPDAWATLDTCLREGGPDNTALALAWATHLAGFAPSPASTPAKTALYATLPSREGPEAGLANAAPKAAIILYRSHHLSADTAPIDALCNALQIRGLASHPITVPSLKNVEAATWLAQTLAALKPAVILNATAFSARTGDASPLDAAGCPVLQLVLSASTEPAWRASTRGLSPTDLAMQVVLPELDGRLLTTAISFKAETPRHPVLQYARTVHHPHPPGIAHAADQAAGWARLANTPPADRRLAILLTDYPNGQQGHAVGLDTFASLETIIRHLHASYPGSTRAPTRDLTAALTQAAPTPFTDFETYLRLKRTLPLPLQSALQAAWGEPSAGDLSLRHLRIQNTLIALQPPRGHRTGAKAQYHDPDLPPCHAYVAFHLWLRHVLGAHAIIQLGAHGSLEWLPGKSAALGDECWPQALCGALPVIYPFIVNNPGEAAAAKRRLGAVTIGHLTPPIAPTTHHGPARTLERLIDEYATADGLDRRRTTLLRGQILEQAAAAGLLHEAGPARPIETADETLARLDAYLCDVKDLQLRDGLHVFGADRPGADPASTAAERQALADALDGRFIQPGPAGAPSRGRPDVLPTGRNLTTIDPRHIPTPSAMTLAARAAETVLRRHLQDHGEYPRAVVLDMWGSTAMRTGGEDLALAYHLLGARPVWDDGTGRVSGFEVTPIALLDRPRIDVTLRVSGLFRDAFGAALSLFDQLTRTLAARDEAPDWNPLTPAPRIYGPAPGQYGAGDGSGESWLAASSTPFALDDRAPDPAALAARIAAADAFVHTQDHAETDLLDSPDTAAHEGGFAQAAASLGTTPALYHLDTSKPGAPKSRTVAEEIRRVVRARAANPAWIAGMMRHAHRGAGEITRPLAALELYARTLPDRFDRQFDLLHEATLGTPEVDAFIRRNNPEAHQDLLARYDALRHAGLWHPTQNALSSRERVE